MGIVSAFVREQQRYSKEQLKEKFDLDNISFIYFIEKLKAYGVLKMVDNTSKQKNLSDLNEDDFEIVDMINYDNGDYLYVFTFVGVLTIGHIVIKCFPKYLLSDGDPNDEMKEILEVLSKFNYHEQIVYLFNGYDNEKEFNSLAIMLYIIRDFQDNGVYSHKKDVIETNGEGEILWENTINENLALIINNMPIYMELQTKNIIYNEDDYISRLHKCIVTECCQILKNANLLEIFGLNEINVSDEKREDFGGDDLILYNLIRELNSQFVTRKQILLKTLYSYIAFSDAFRENFGLSLYGTNSFHVVWEKVCAEVFDNKLGVKLKNLDFPIDLHDDFQNKKECSLLKIIPKPCWKPNGSNEKHKSDTLIPDLISLYEFENEWYFGIFDAKYYNIILDDNNLQNNPGIGDVTKQVLYQLAYHDFIEKHDFNHVINAFLMPSEKDSSELIGEVEMPIFTEISNFLMNSEKDTYENIGSISIVRLSARKIYNHYLKGKKLNICKEIPFLN